MLNKNKKENAIQNLSLCKNYYILEPSSDTISCEHCTAEAKIIVHFSSLKISMFRETNKQQHKLYIVNSHYIRNEHRPFE